MSCRFSRLSTAVRIWRITSSAQRLGESFLRCVVPGLLQPPTYTTRAGGGGAGGYFFLSVILIINRNAEGSVAVATLPVTILELVDVKLTIFAHVM